MENIIFKTKGSLLRAKSIEEIWREQGEGFIPSSFFIIKSSGIYVLKSAAVYDTNELGDMVKIQYVDGKLNLDVSRISHSIIFSSDSLDVTDYIGPIKVEIEKWSKQKAVARKDFDFITQYIVELFQQKIDLTNGEKEKIDKEISYLKSYWVKSFEKDFLSLNIIAVVYNYYDFIDRSSVNNPSMIDILFELKEETQEIIRLSEVHIQNHLTLEFADLTRDEKEELTDFLKEKDGYEFLALLGDLT